MFGAVVTGCIEVVEVVLVEVALAEVPEVALVEVALSEVTEVTFDVLVVVVETVLVEIVVLFFL